MEWLEPLQTDFFLFLLFSLPVLKIGNKVLEVTRKEMSVDVIFVCFKVSQHRAHSILHQVHTFYLYSLWHSTFILYIVPENTFFLEVVSHDPTQPLTLKHTEHCITIYSPQLLKGIKADI